jgi:epoxyqueuosine reductase
MTEAFTRTDLAPLAIAIKSWGVALGFQAVGIADADLGATEARLADWLARGFHGEMDYMARHGAKRARPAALVPGTLRVISARMDYRPVAADAGATLADRSKAYVSRYALGRDYHKVLRARLQRLAVRIETEVDVRYRVFTDSAPVMEVELARAGLAGAESTPWRLRARPDRSSSSARSTPTCRCRSIVRSPSTAARARAASRRARPARSSGPISSTRDGASRISRSS